MAKKEIEEKIMLETEIVHSKESLAKEYNSEVIVPKEFYPKKDSKKNMFKKDDWLFLKNIAQSSPSNDIPVRNIKIKRGIDVFRLNCKHRTQPGRNFSVFYRRIDEHMIMILGVGYHESRNTKYAVSWLNGNETQIDLNKTTSSGDEFLANPIEGFFDFKTMDSILNESWLKNDKKK